MTKSTADKLNDVLQGERSAAETYKQALEKFGTDPRADQLREIQADHFRAVTTLKQHVEIRGEVPEQDSGVWGAFAKTVMGSAKLFGDKAALTALKQGEEHGLKQYNSLIEDESIDLSVRRLVQTKMIPQQMAHIRSIDSVIKQFG